MSFNTLSKISNEIGLYWINKLFENKDVIITEELDKYSDNDFVVEDDKGKMLIEVKLRNRYFDRLVLEKDKNDRLLEKAKKLNIKRIYYLNVFTTDKKDYSLVMFNIKKVLKDYIHLTDTLMLPGNIENTPRKTILCKYLMNKYSAISSNKVAKLTYIIPVEFGLCIK